MYKINQVTNDSYQKQTILLFDKTKVDLTLYYMPLQYSWFIKELVYGTFTLNNIRVCNSPNILFQFRNKIPFGLACFSKGPREPMLSTDFSNGYSSLYILTASEVTSYAEYITGA